MESAKTSRSFLVAVLLLAVVALAALDIYQDRVIAKQHFEIRWLLTHSTIRLDAIAADSAKKPQASAQVNGPQVPAASVAQLPPAAKPASPASGAKP